MSIPISPDLPDTDLSNIAFSKIFGENWWAITEHTMPDGPFFQILKEINLLLMTAVVGWTLLTLVRLISATAQEGVVGGDKTNLVWWPIRAGFGITMTAPLTSTGLSLFQAGILICLGWACTWANGLYTSSMDYLAKSNFAAVTAEMPPQMQMEAKEIARVLMNANLVQHYISKATIEMNSEANKRGIESDVPVWSGFSPFAVNAHSSSLASNTIGLYKPRWIIKFSVPSSYGLKSEDLGGIEIPGDADDAMLKAKVNGIVAMENIIQTAAGRIVYNLEQTDSEWLTKAVKAYQTSVQDVITNFAEYYPELEVTQKAEAFREKADELGWMAAGAWPMIMSSLSREALDKISNPVIVSQLNSQNVSLQCEDILYGSLSTTLAAGNAQFEYQPDPSSVGTSIKSALLSGSVAGFLDTVLYGISGRWTLQSLLSRFEHEDPILVITQFGHTLMDSAGVMATLSLTLKAASGYLGGVKDSLLAKVGGVFSAGQSDGFMASAAKVGDAISDWLFWMATGLFGVGLILAYVMPLMPMLYWCIAMVGFLLLVVEVLVAAPFWVAAHAWGTTEEGLTGEMGKQGYYQFLEILFRPILYVTGFIAIFMLMRVAGWIVARIFEAYYYSYANSNVSAIATHTGLITSVAMCFIVSGLFVYLMYFLFSEGYSHLPKKVMSWVGHQTASMGLAGHANSMQRVIMGGAVAGINKAGGQAHVLKSSQKRGQDKDQNREDGKSKNLPGSMPFSGHDDTW